MQKYLCFVCSGMRQLDMLAYGVQIEAMSLFDRLSQYKSLEKT